LPGGPPHRSHYVEFHVTGSVGAGGWMPPATRPRIFLTVAEIADHLTAALHHFYRLNHGARPRGPDYIVGRCPSSSDRQPRAVPGRRPLAGKAAKTRNRSEDRRCRECASCPADSDRAHPRRCTWILPRQLVQLLALATDVRCRITQSRAPNEYQAAIRSTHLQLHTSTRAGRCSSEPVERQAGSRLVTEPGPR
jgi:hypothetical protein